MDDIEGKTSRPERIHARQGHQARRLSRALAVAVAMLLPAGMLVVGAGSPAAGATTPGPLLTTTATTGLTNTATPWPLWAAPVVLLARSSR